MSNILEIYTDGACSQNRDGNWHGGYGVYIDWKTEPIGLSGGAINTTNNEMELTALLESFKYILDRIDFIKEEYNEIIIYTDSAYISNAFNQSWYTKWKRNGWLTSKKKPIKNKELWQSIVSFYSTISDSILLNIKKVKAHSDINGNVIADDLAVKERKSFRKQDNIKIHRKSEYDSLE